MLLLVGIRCFTETVCRSPEADGKGPTSILQLGKRPMIQFSQFQQSSHLKVQKCCHQIAQKFAEFFNIHQIICIVFLLAHWAKVGTSFLKISYLGYQWTSKHPIPDRIYLFIDATQFVWKKIYCSHTERMRTVTSRETANCCSSFQAVHKGRILQKKGGYFTYRFGMQT